MAAAVESAPPTANLTVPAHHEDKEEESQTLSRYNSPEAIEPATSRNDSTSTSNDNSLQVVLNTRQAKRSSSPRPGLPPVRTPLAIMPTYIRQSSIEVTLRMTRKIHGQYTIKTTDKEPIFHIDVHGAFYKTRTIYDAKLDIALLELKDRHNTKTLQISVKRPSPDGSKAMEVGEEKHGGFVGGFENFAVGLGARLTSGGGGESEIYVKDDEDEGWALIGPSTIRSRNDDQIVATVKRSNELNDPEYTVTIAPGVDMSLIVAFCIAMDHKWSKEKRPTGERTDSGIGMSHGGHE